MEVADGYDPLMFARAVKTDTELRLLERSTRLNEAAIRRTVEAWDKGATWRDLNKAYAGAVIDLGGFVRDPGGMVWGHPRGADTTIMLATDTFLQGYARAAGENDLASVRYVIAGAERVKGETRKLWGKHGTVILEGYGATECSPVIAVSLPDRNRPGSVGPILPGIEWRLDPVEGDGHLQRSAPRVGRGGLDGDVGHGAEI